MTPVGIPLDSRSHQRQDERRERSRPQSRSCNHRWRDSPRLQRRIPTKLVVVEGGRSLGRTEVLLLSAGGLCARLRIFIKQMIPSISAVEREEEVTR